MEADVAIGLRERLEAQRTAFRLQPPGYRERRDALRRLERALLKHKEDLIAAKDEADRARISEALDDLRMIRAAF